MFGKKFSELGGIAASVVLIAFGVGAIYMGVDGRSTVRDSLKTEQITFGAADDPAVAKFASAVGREPVTTGSPGSRVRADHPRACARGRGRPDLLADGTVHLRRRSGERGRHER